MNRFLDAEAGTRMISAYLNFFSPHELIPLVAAIQLSLQDGSTFTMADVVGLSLGNTPTQLIVLAIAALSFFFTLIWLWQFNGVKSINLCYFWSVQETHL